jgi:hypothetical protein
MTKKTLTALDFYIITDTLYQSLRFSNWGGSTTTEARQKVLEHIQEIMWDMNVEVLTETPNPEIITADTGI